MAVVVSDTTPLNYLVLIEAIDVLPRLYDRVLIPAVVWDELAQPETPEPVLNWLAQSPSGLEVTNPMPSADPTLSIWMRVRRRPSLWRWNAEPISS